MTEQKKWLISLSVHWLVTHNDDRFHNMNYITLHQCTAVVGIVNLQYCRGKFIKIFFIHLAALSNDDKQISRQYTKIVYLFVTCIMYY